MGALALVVVVTAAAHAAVPSLRGWSRGRGERLVREELARQERALVRCLLGGEVTPGEDLVERVAGIETALAALGEASGNDALHWPGRCAPLARTAADLAHLGRPVLRRDELETLALVLGEDRSLDGALRAIEDLSSPTLGTEADDCIVEEVGGAPPAPWRAEISAGSLPDTSGLFLRQPLALARSLDGTSESIERAELQVPFDRRIRGGSRSISASHPAPIARWGWSSDLPRAGCILDVGRWSVEACGTMIRALGPRDAARLEQDPRVEPDHASVLGAVEPLRGDHPRWMVPCLARGAVAAVVLPGTTPRREARVVPVVDGVPRPAWVATAPADQIRCDGDAVELAGVRVIGEGRLAVQRDVCGAEGCRGESIDLDDVAPEALRPRGPDHVAVAMLGEELVVGWIARRRDVFIKRGSLAELPRAPLRLIHRATRLPEPTRIDALSSPRAAALALAAAPGRSFAVLTIDHAGAVSGVVPREETR